MVKLWSGTDTYMTMEQNRNRKLEQEEWDRKAEGFLKMDKKN